MSMLKSKVSPALTPAPAEVPRQLRRLRLRQFPRRCLRRAQDFRAGSRASPAPVGRQRERHPVDTLGHRHVAFRCLSRR